MSYIQLKQRLDAGDVIVLDGGTGTELERRGVAMSPEAWCGPATLGNAELLTQIHLDYINAGSDVIAMIGASGSGKSTFSKIIAGHPAYEILGGDIIFKGSSILELDPEERSHLGIFLAFQYPIEIPGVSNEDFLRLAYNSKQKFLNKPEVDPIEFFSIITEKLKSVNMSSIFLSRNVNEGFSGGEKKRNEILQMILQIQLTWIRKTEDRNSESKRT